MQKSSFIRTKTTQTEKWIKNQRVEKRFKIVFKQGLFYCWQVIHFVCVEYDGYAKSKGGKMHEQKWMQIYCKCTRCSRLGEQCIFGFQAMLVWFFLALKLFLGCKWAMHSGKEWLIFVSVLASKKNVKSSGFNGWQLMTRSTLPCALRVEWWLAHTCNEKREMKKKLS